MATECLYTTVVNLTGSERVFGFLPPHGKRLAANEQYSVRGNLIDQIAKNDRKSKGLQRALDDENIAIVETPAVHIVDDTSGAVKQLRLNGGTLGVVDPCWGAYDTTP